MGQTIGWFEWNPETQRTSRAKSYPDWFDGKFTGRWEFFLACITVAHDEVDKCSYTGESLIRPTDFPALRELVKGLPKTDNPFYLHMCEDMVQYLEDHPYIYINYG